MTSIQLFNNLNGKEVSRNYLEEILQQAKTENQTDIVYRVSKILNDYPNVQHFDINIVQYPAPQGLAGAMHTGDYREALDDCGRLRKGWKFVKGNVVKVEKKEKKEVSKPKKQVTKTEKKATETEKEYKITHEIRLQYPKSYTDADIIASMKKMDKFRDKIKKTACKTCGNTESKQNSIVEKSSNALTVAGDSATKLNIILSSTEKENQSAKDIQDIFDKKLSKMLRLQSGFINTNEFDFKAPKTSKKGIESFERIVTKDELRPALTGVLIEKDFYVGTDAHKLLVIERTKNDGLKTGKIYDVNAKYSKYLSNFNNIDDALPEKEWNDKKRYIDEVFPNYQNIFPKQYKYKTPFVDIEPILNHAYKAYYLLKFDVQKNDNYTIPFRIGNMEIYINTLKLFESLQCLYVNGTKQVSFECVAYNRIMAIKSKENKNVALLMPVFETKKTELNVNEVQISATENKDFKESQGLAAPCLSGLAAPTAQSSETIAFNKEILKAKREGFNTDKVLKLGKAKGELKKIVGDKEMRISQATIKKAMTKDDSHIITWENLINLPDYLNNPLAIFKSKTAGFVVLTEIINAKNKPVIAPLHIVTKGNYIEVKSLYSRKNDSTYQNWVKEDLLLYINKKSDLAFKTMGTIPNLDSKSQDKNTKKSVSGKKTAENFGLGLPLTNEIRKKAFTDKRKLRKGWYYEENGLLTDGKEFYISDRYAGEYSAIINRLDRKTQKKRQDLQKMLYDRQERDYETYRKEQGKIIDCLVDKYKIEKRLDFQYNILEAFVRNGQLYEHISVNRGATNKKVMSFKDLVKIDNKDKYNFTYSLTPKGKEIILEYKNKIDEMVEKVEGNNQKIKQKYGLSAPISFIETPQEVTPAVAHHPEVFVEEFTETSQVQPEIVNSLPAVAHHRKGSLIDKLATQPTDWDFFQIDEPQMSQFLGKVERKTKDSLVITLTGGQGSGKTRFAFQFINALGQRYKVGHISIEEHPESFLYDEKIHQYLNRQAQGNTLAFDVRSISELDKIIRENEVIVIDSFQKLRELDRKFEVDKDLRKKYDGKLFLVIYQQTTDGKMKGGSSSQYDGDIILFTEKFPNYQENYVYPDKNRYNPIPADQLKYNIFQQRLLPVETEEQVIEKQAYDVIY
ncbi:hypothetical protein CGC48_00690 [Capnocytophaga cynodegmi]|uniref:Phage MuF C-terminal domain-containing protein n=1 Tax=Capnocytophaga cynodegmi TaxID=28189 RepID=A0A286NTD4_9FLAO|nr:hypothetical protein [Capnocytophaga cynodegmi]ATA67261.1 hypothetical protein CGC48_00690 [Capnocytophaga cynodegmi]